MLLSLQSHFSLYARPIKPAIQPFVTKGLENGVIQRLDDPSAFSGAGQIFIVFLDLLPKEDAFLIFGQRNILRDVLVLDLLSPGLNREVGLSESAAGKLL